MWNFIKKFKKKPEPEGSNPSDEELKLKKELQLKKELNESEKELFSKRQFIGFYRDRSVYYEPDRDIIFDKTYYGFSFQKHCLIHIKDIDYWFQGWYNLKPLFNCTEFRKFQYLRDKEVIERVNEKLLEDVAIYLEKLKNKKLLKDEAIYLEKLKTDP